MNSCPCCSYQLLRHARHNRVYWFCSHCWEEMPALSEMILGDRQRTRKIDSLVKVSALRPKLTVLASVEIA
ncbi:MAG: hypothetical protein EAZ78_24610 [Oscillatoriales cyanobacterium]|nr:MAG: hypothetical protein EA000_04300 [Oscillatoriales cyanobacterium]TAD94276.1 MAG: hypothetical protein EAZ98_19930 [Oscillatoriales cyanobacterium]TAE01620.1 MAG: hypothetical protein EAZ96_18450 [Oscillatoriales cyanobacterium]TAE98218.1 MAG: hypothetical protein EAZ78_24610 [Oscillatoriales cyanobacterium]TAF33890.1 MAG: hypothetical protein EAZ68_19580 [Oscillatoriales cyanobacterium]